MLERAVEDGALDRNPTKGVRLAATPARRPRFLTVSRREALLAAARAHGRDAYLLVACGVYLGLRKAELCALRWSDVDLDEKVVHVQNSAEFTTKNGRNRTIPLCDELHAILSDHSRASCFVLKPENLYVAGRRYRWDFRGLLKSLVAAAGLDHAEITPHILRHTFASICAQHRVSLHKIATWMGHSTTEVTEMYAHLCAYDPDINLMRSGASAAASPPPRSPAHLRIVK